VPFRWLCTLGLVGCVALIAAPDRLVKIPVWMDPAAGQPATKAGIRARLEGASSTVLDVLGPEDDLMMLVVLDLSDDLALAQAAKDGLTEGIRKLPAHAYVAVLRAQDGLRVLTDPTTDREQSAQAIAELPVSGKAGFLDTIETMEELGDSILSKAAVRVAVLYITDSDIKNYRQDYTNPVINSSDSHDLSRKFPEALIQDKVSRLSDRLAFRQTPLFLVHLRDRSDRLNKAYQNGVQQLAQVTGGSSVFCRSSTEIPGAIHHMLQIIASHYSVTLAVPEHAGKSVQVQLEADGERRLSYRTRIVLHGR